MEAVIRVDKHTPAPTQAWGSELQWLLQVPAETRLEFGKALAVLQPLDSTWSKTSPEPY